MKDKFVPIQIIESISSADPKRFDTLYALLDESEALEKEKGIYMLDFFTNKTIKSTARAYAEGKFFQMINSPLSRMGYTPAQIDSRVHFEFTLAVWRKHKECFSFSKEMQNLLLPLKDDLKIPCDVYKTLPFPCLYIELEKHPRFSGFFAEYIENTMNRFGTESFIGPAMELIFIMRNEKEAWISYRVPLKKDMLLSDYLSSIVDLEDYFKDNYDEDINLIPSDKVRAFDLCHAFDLLTYLCCDNREYTESSRTKGTYKPTEKVTDSFKEVRIWDAGETITRSIRLYKKTRAGHSADSKARTHGNRPHMRAAHYQHYWVGPRDSDERKLIVHWIEPIYVNANAGDVPVKITKVTE